MVRTGGERPTLNVGNTIPLARRWGGKKEKRKLAGGQNSLFCTSWSNMLWLVSSLPHIPYARVSWCTVMWRVFLSFPLPELLCHGTKEFSFLLRIPVRCCVRSDVRSNEYSCHGCGWYFYSQGAGQRCYWTCTQQSDPAKTKKYPAQSINGARVEAAWSRRPCKLVTESEETPGLLSAWYQ